MYDRALCIQNHRDKHSLTHTHIDLTKVSRLITPNSFAHCKDKSAQPLLLRVAVVVVAEMKFELVSLSLSDSQPATKIILYENYYYTAAAVAVWCLMPFYSRSSRAYWLHNRRRKKHTPPCLSKFNNKQHTLKYLFHVFP